MPRNDLTEEQFLRDVAKHQMTVLRDDGLNRHIRFRKPGTCVMGFDLITWKGHLCYTGDMGTFVFSRIEDMFEFFRTERVARSTSVTGKTLFVNHGYWAEKCLAHDREGIEVYSPDRFRELIKERLDDQDASDEVRREVEEEVLSWADNGEDLARSEASSYRHRSGFEFSDFWESNLRVYTVRFVWCCYALAWGIGQYDLSRAPRAEVQQVTT
jgi:hypothetical protein